MTMTVMDLPWANKEFVANYLAQTYYYVKHSEKLLALAIVRLEDDKLVRRFKEHLEEENAHEKLALADLKRLGKSLNDYPELGLTRAFYESQYFKVEYKHPLALMGYIQYLETMAAEVGINVFNAIKDNLGIESSFLKVHGEEDIDHVEKANQMIASLPDILQKEIQDNYDQSKIVFEKLVSSIAEASNGAS